MMSNWDLYLEERQRYVQRAKAAAFLDAVFLIIFYNRDAKRWGPPPKPADIESHEVFEEVQDEQYQDALKRSQRLLSGGTDVGAAYFRYPHATLTYEEQLAQFEASNPGFSKECYSLAAQSGIRDMR
jgi:hypothetical protein